MQETTKMDMQIMNNDLIEDIKFLVKEIDVITTEKENKILSIIDKIKIEINSMNLTYNEAYALLKKSSFTNSEFCEIMGEIRCNLL